jgi:hypothetical protein
MNEEALPPGGCCAKIKRHIQRISRTTDLNFAPPMNQFFLSV